MQRGETRSSDDEWQVGTKERCSSAVFVVAVVVELVVNKSTARPIGIRARLAVSGC